VRTHTYTTAGFSPLSRPKWGIFWVRLSSGKAPRERAEFLSALAKPVMTALWAPAGPFSGVEAMVTDEEMLTAVGDVIMARLTGNAATYTVGNPSSERLSSRSRARCAGARSGTLAGQPTWAGGYHRVVRHVESPQKSPAGTAKDKGRFRGDALAEVGGVRTSRIPVASATATAPAHAQFQAYLASQDLTGLYSWRETVPDERGYSSLGPTHPHYLCPNRPPLGDPAQARPA
jgi:hypothetical protein